MNNILFILNNFIIAMAVLPGNAAAQTEALTQGAAGGFLDSPYLVVAILALLQGLISRAGLASALIVVVVIPAIVMWGVVPDLYIQAEGTEYFLSIGIELLKILACSLLAWGAGLAIHSGVLRLLSGR